MRGTWVWPRPFTDPTSYRRSTTTGWIFLPFLHKNDTFPIRYPYDTPWISSSKLIIVRSKLHNFIRDYHMASITRLFLSRFKIIGGIRLPIMRKAFRPTENRTAIALHTMQTCSSNTSRFGSRLCSRLTCAREDRFCPESSEGFFCCIRKTLHAQREYLKNLHNCSRLNL